MRKSWKKLAIAAMLLTFAACSVNGCKKSGNNDSVKAAVQEAEKSDEDRGNALPETESSSVEADLTRETAPAMKETDEIVYVTGDNVNLRKDGQFSAEVIDSAAFGTKLRRTGYSDAWSRVSYNGVTCYISTQYVSTTQPETKAEKESGAEEKTGEGTAVSLNPSWKYADFSKIHTGTATLYKSQASDKKGVTICVNAGHGTKGGSNVKTLCHPDGTPKVTSGSTKAGATSAIAVSSGMEFLDGTSEVKVTLAMAKTFKKALLAEGYDVLMIRDTDDVQLDNIARTVIANNMADCHIAIHWDSSTNDKGAFYMSVPDIASYKNMEPVKSHWQQHNALGESVIGGLKAAGVKIFSNGAMGMDLTQTSYSTVPSIDIELGDKGSDYSQPVLDKMAAGMVKGVNTYFGKS